MKYCCEIIVRRCPLLLLLIATALALYQTAVAQQRPESNDEVLESVSTRTDLYPANANAKDEIQESLKRAATEKKRLLLIFGANWCYDCHVLDRALHEGTAGKIVSENFLLVHVDIGEGANNADLIKLYRIPLSKGVPAVAIVNSDGKILYSSGDGEFEASRQMMKKDLVAFLNHWKPHRQ